MVVFDPVCEGFQKERNLQECASFQGCSGKVPILFSLPIGQVYGVLEVEEHSADDLSHHNACIDFEGRNPKYWEQIKI